MKQLYTNRLARSNTTLTFYFMFQTCSSHPLIQSSSWHNQPPTISSSTLTMSLAALTPCTANVSSPDVEISKTGGVQHQQTRGNLQRPQKRAHQSDRHNEDSPAYEQLHTKQQDQHFQIRLPTSTKLRPPTLTLHHWIAGNQSGDTDCGQASHLPTYTHHLRRRHCTHSYGQQLGQQLHIAHTAWPTTTQPQHSSRKRRPTHASRDGQQTDTSTSQKKTSLKFTPLCTPIKSGGLRYPKAQGSRHQGNPNLNPLPPPKKSQNNKHRTHAAKAHRAIKTTPSLYQNHHCSLPRFPSHHLDSLSLTNSLALRSSPAGH